MIPTVTGHQWSEETLFCKARLYAEQMEKFSKNDWQFGLWSALGLELLARAALAHISPVLLADPQNWRNLTHVLGKSPTSQKFSPKTLSTGELLIDWQNWFLLSVVNYVVSVRNTLTGETRNYTLANFRSKR